MKIRDWIAQHWRARREPRREALISISRQLDKACALDDFDTLAALLKRYRHSAFATKLIGTRMIRGGYPMIVAPHDAVRGDVLKMLDALHRTHDVRQFGGSLTAIPAEPFNPLYDLLAMHTFMADAYLKLHPHETRLQRPALSQVQAATRLLDRWHKEDYARELTDLIFHHEYPSEYLALRFGWEDEYRHARHLEARSGISSAERPFEERRMLYEDRELLYAGWEKKAEEVLENLSGIMLPDRYVVKLQAELEQLAAFVRCPESTSAPNADRGLLEKYGITKDAPRAMCERQVERAFRALDARLVRLTGCRPQSDRLFARLKPRDAPHTATARIIGREYPKKGRKHSL